MKIIGFSQLRNELSKGNLENWFKSMGMCEYVYIFDQASDDGSHDVYEQHDNVVLIQSEENLFRQEILCKKQLLEKLLLDIRIQTGFFGWTEPQFSTRDY